jgi:hypothetical protein
LLRIEGDKLAKANGIYFSTQNSRRKSKPSFLGRGGTISKHINSLANKNNMVMGPKENRNQE